MSKDDRDMEEFIDKLKGLYHETPSGRKNWSQEGQVQERIFPIIREKLLGQYELIAPYKMGGSGIISLLHDLRVPGDEPVQRALKTPRPIRGVLTTIESEAKHLVNVRHRHIIPIHYMDSIQLDKDIYPFFIMDFIHQARDLREFTEELMVSARGEIDASRSAEAFDENKKELLHLSSKKLGESADFLSSALGDIASALQYLHSYQIVHFDVKPANILVNKDGTALLADLGFAKHKDSAMREDTTIGFTEFYAHPELSHRATISYGDKSGKRMRKLLSPSEFNFSWDIFAFGKSILELMNLIERNFPNAPTYSYQLNYLHLAACRMLDGRNASRAELERDRSPTSHRRYYEEWYGLTSEDFQDNSSLPYKDMDSIVGDLQKLNRPGSLTNQIAELSTTGRKRIRTDRSYSAPFTARVKAIVEHPAFARLRTNPQLGLTSLIYPTATHTRFEHSLGVFSLTCEYVRSLWADEGNPLFRQWMTNTDIRALLVAALVHDIGQFPLCHDLEDSPASRGLFNHIEIGITFLDSNIKNRRGRTLRQIIEDKNEGWGVNLDSVRKIMRATKMPGVFPSLEDVTVGDKELFLSSILSSDIDADKVDYLVRDSRASELAFGASIDVERLIKTLTTAIFIRPDPIDPDDVAKSKRTLEIAIYEKGKSAAEAIGFARYLLFQALYWQHTSRAIRVMLLEAVSGIFSNDEREFNNVKRAFHKLIGIPGRKQSLGMMDLAIGTDEILEFLHKRGTDMTKELIDLIQERRLYKRIITAHRRTRGGNQKPSTYEMLKKKRKKIKPVLRELMHEAFDRFRTKNIESLLAPTEAQVETVHRLLSQEHSLLIDIPEERLGSSISLCIIPELEGLKRNYDAKMNASQIMGKVWGDIHSGLMEYVCKARIYCHPEIRDPLLSVLGFEELNSVFEKALRRT